MASSICIWYIKYIICIYYARSSVVLNHIVYFYLVQLYTNACRGAQGARTRVVDVQEKHESNFPSRTVTSSTKDSAKDCDVL